MRLAITPSRTFPCRGPSLERKVDIMLKQRQRTTTPALWLPLSVLAAGLLVPVSPKAAQAASGCMDVSGQSLTVGEVTLNEPVCGGSGSGILVKLEGNPR